MTIYQKTIELPSDFSPISIRQLLNNWLLSRKMQHLLRVNQQILINDSYRSFNQLVYAKDKVTLKFDYQMQQFYNLAETITSEIIFENDDFLIMNKHYGIKTHPNQPDENNTLMNELTTYLAAKQQRPFMVHRLDQQTSGAILVAKNPIITSLLNRQLQAKTMQRFYQAIVFDPDQNLLDKGTINLAIDFDPNDQRKRRIDPNGLPAVTHYQVFETSGDYKHLQLQLETGRTHQIRVHLAAKNAAIVGDPLYSEIKAQRLMLHANQIQLQKPFATQLLRFEVPSKLPNLKELSH